MKIDKLVLPHVRTLSAYQAKEIPCRAKLDANESPFGFSIPSDIVRSLPTNRYPDPEGLALKEVIARELKVKPANILLGNGSDEIIYYLITTFGGPVLFPVPTFTMFGIIARALGEERIAVPLDGAFDLDLKKMLPAIRREKPKLIFFSSPNNPTGNCFSVERILKIVESAAGRAIVVVDEAYQPFASEQGFLPLLGDYPHLVILRTLSKIGLAGLRVGFLVAGEEIVREVNKVRLPFNVNAFSQAVALDVLLNRKAIRKNIRVIVTERDRLLGALSKIDGVVPYPSEANFILFRVTDPDKTHRALLEMGVLVRNMKGVVDGCLRVTVGTPGENRMFVAALRKIAGKEGFSGRHGKSRDSLRMTK